MTGLLPLQLVILLHILHVLSLLGRPRLYTPFQHKALHAGVLLLVDVVREPGGRSVAAAAGRPWETIRMVFMETEHRCEKRDRMAVEGRAAGSGEGMLTAVPDHLAHPASFEDIVQRGNGRVETLSGQVYSPEDRSALRKKEVSFWCLIGLFIHSALGGTTRLPHSRSGEGLRERSCPLVAFRSSVAAKLLLG